MILKDFKARDRVSIYVNKEGVLCGPDGVTEYTLPATVLKLSYDDIVIGWEPEDKIPLGNGSCNIRTTTTHGVQYPGIVAWILASSTRRTAGYADGPCRQCSKQNSSQDNKCWWCQVSYPTDLKRKGP